MRNNPVYILIAISILALVSAALAVFVDLIYIAFFLAIVILVYLASRYLNLGLYLIVLFYPFIELQLVWGEINVPYVDLIALFVFAGWLVRIIKNKKISWSYFPGLIFFVLFFLSSLLSLINAPDFWASLKFILRPLGFFYLMFIVLPYNLITSERILRNIFKIFYGLGIFTAFLGALSLVLVPASSLLAKRVVPLSIFGVYPLGHFHNQIAEVLVTVIPLGFILMSLAKKDLSRKLIFLGTMFMIIINLLTFSRSAWIALILEITLLLLLQYRYQLKGLIKPSLVIALILLPLAVYMFVFSGQSMVASSNVNRLMLIDYALDLWQDHPFIGYGAGTFMTFLANDPFYILEFGSPLDAHGFVWKILPELGLAGLLTFLSCLAYVFYCLFKVYFKALNRWQSYLVLTMLIIGSGSLIFQFFQTSYFLSRLWLPLGIGLAVAKLVQKK